MNILVTADVHVSDRVVQNRPRLPVYAKLLDRIRATALQRDCEHVVIIGDFIDQKNKMPRDVYLLVYDFLTKCKQEGLTVHWVRGNHETPSRTNPEMDCLMRLFDRVCQVYTRPGHIKVGDRQILFLPWYPREQYLRYIEMAIKQFDDGSILFTHIGLREGQTSPSNYYPRGDVTVNDLHPEKWSIVLCGDYHAHQKLAPNVAYCGAPIAHNYGDWNIKGLWLLNVNTDPGDFRVKTSAVSLADFPQFYQYEIATLPINAEIVVNNKDYTRCYVASHLIESFRSSYVDNPNLDIRPLHEAVIEAEAPTNSRISLEDAGSDHRLCERWLNHKKVTTENYERLLEIGTSFLK